MTKTSIFVSKTHQSWLLNVADLEVLAYSRLHQPHHRLLEDHRLRDVVVVRIPNQIGLQCVQHRPIGRESA